MGLTYFKRYRMEIDLAGSLFTPPPLPDSYTLVPWSPQLLEAHAEAKYRSFCFEIDANVFPCLGQRDGCQRLMEEISSRDVFLPEATWLAQFAAPDDGLVEVCGTIQGIRDLTGMGAVQNLGIVPTHRRRHLGSCLLRKALDGFQEAGLRRAYLEVTAQNVGALRLYRRLGFHTVKTVYKAVEVAYA